MQMNTDTQSLDLSGFNTTPHGSRGGTDVSFPNGYGASIIHHATSYGYSDGLFELAVRYAGDITYRTPITDDVLGCLTADDVLRTLEQIKQL